MKDIIHKHVHVFKCGSYDYLLMYVRVLKKICISGNKKIMIVYDQVKLIVKITKFICDIYFYINWSLDINIIW